MTRAMLMTTLRLGIGWAAVVSVLFAGSSLAGLPPTAEAALFAALLALMIWSAFGVTAEADHLAEILGEPFGTLILTLSIVLIEVALVAAVMLGGDGAETLARDTMFAVVMCVLNGIVGLGLLVGGLRHGAQGYSAQGARAFLSVIIPLSTVAFVLPSFTRTTPGGTLSFGQEVAFAIFTAALYAVFLFVQTVRHPDFFGGGETDAGPEAAKASTRTIATHAALLVASILPIVLLSKTLAKLLDHGLQAAALPLQLGGVVIALIVLTPEGIAAVRAVSSDQLQRAVNLCLGAAASTIGLTLPVVVAVAAATGQTIVLGLSPQEMVVLVMTLVLSTLTFSGARTTILEGAMHLMVFFVYLTLIFAP